MPFFDGEYGPDTYGDRLADIFDEFYGSGPPMEHGVPLLAELAEGGPALELGIGTGRVALPLQQMGVEIHGIDASQRMVEKLREKQGGDSIPVTIGDFANVVAPAAEYSLVFVVWNTFFALPSQDEQIKCLTNVENRLRDNGRFLMTGFVPDLERYSRNQSTNVTKLGVDEVRVDYAMLDPISQVVKASHVVIGNGTVNTYPIRLRYCWPSELDLMARLAGLTLESRWSDWSKSEFKSNSNMHVSVYRKQMAQA